MTRWGNYAIHSDQLNTPRQIANGLGFTVWTLPYSAFGTAQPNSSGLIYNLRFAGQYYDGETGLNQNYYRDYDPTTGRYIESDPIGLAGGTNPYAYVGGNPLSLTDPMGLCSSNANNLLSFLTSNPGLLATILATEIVGGGPEDPVADAAVAAEIADAEAIAAEEAAITTGARDAAVEFTQEGERFVRVGAGPENLKFTFDTTGGVQPGTYAFPESTFQ